MLLKPLLKKIHLWLGMTSGLIIFILGITGAIYVFEEEIKHLVHSHYQCKEPNSNLKRLPLDSLHRFARASLGDSCHFQTLEFTNSRPETLKFTSYQEKKTGNAIWYWELIEHYNIVFINPFTGEVAHNASATFDFFEVTFMAHWSLLLNPEIGQPIVGAAVLLFIASLVSGLIIWWPKSKKSWQQRLKFTWKVTTKWKRKNYDLHSILGFYVFLFGTILGLTGLMWAFDWFEEGVISTLNQTETPYIKHISDPQKQTALPLESVCNKLGSLYPELTHYKIKFTEEEKETLSIFIHDGKSINGKYFQVDQYSGTILAQESFEDQQKGDQLSWINYDIHVGKILGLTGQILAFISSLIIASLPVTGFLFWIGKHAKKSTPVV